MSSKATPAPAGSQDNSSKKRDVILAAAYGAFSAYGFRRTSMGDIAEAAGISRPALYIQFENKPDIFRALVRKLLDDSIVETRNALSGNSPLPDRLQAALEAGFIRFHREIGKTPHGEELFSAKSELAGNLGDDWLATLQSLFVEALEKASRTSPIPAAEAAALIMDAMIGMKQRGVSVADMEHRSRALITLVVGEASP